MCLLPLHSPGFPKINECQIITRHRYVQAVFFAEIYTRRRASLKEAYLQFFQVRRVLEWFVFRFENPRKQLKTSLIEQVSSLKLKKLLFKRGYDMLLTHVDFPSQAGSRLYRNLVATRFRCFPYA